MKHLFDVGEIIILQSQFCPQFNGEYTVKELKYGEFYHPQQKIVINSFVYDLGIDHGTGHWWFEEALRKRYQKGDMSFRELMSDLKTNIKERA
jgi:hypothetical protein